MGTYQFKARDKFGKPIKGTMDGQSASAVAAKLKDTGYVPISIKEDKGFVKISRFSDLFKKIKLSDLNMFTRQFATLQKAGMPIIRSLNTLSEETANKNFKDIIIHVSTDIEAGANLSSALAKHPKVFGKLYVNTIKSGEASGTLDKVLERLAELGEYEEKVITRIKTATRYPIFVIIAISLGFLVLTTFVIPRFARVYGQFTKALPLPTMILMWFNLLITKYWLALIVITGIIIFAFIKFINTKKGRFWWDNFKLKVPVFGPLMLKLTMSRFTRTTGALMSSGVPLFEILELTSGSVGNVIIARAIDNIKKSVSEGKEISTQMKISGLFPPTVVQMVSVGEQTGRLDQLLIHVSSYYDYQVEYITTNLTTLIEPILIFILGGVVLLMALGIFLPMWNLMNLFRQ